MARSKKGHIRRLGMAVVLAALVPAVLPAAPAAGLKLAAVPTALLVRDGAAVKRVIDVTVENPGAELWPC